MCMHANDFKDAQPGCLRLIIIAKHTEGMELAICTVHAVATVTAVAAICDILSQLNCRKHS